MAGRNKYLDIGDWQDSAYQRKPAHSSKTEPLLSILIPTKNRANTAIECIELAISIGDKDEVEVLVQDCSSSDELKVLIDSRGYAGRIQYARQEGLSMNENWSLAIENSSGKYITIIGDDDAVLPSLMTVVRWANNSGVEAIALSPQSFYGWPDFPEPDKAGLLLLSAFTGQIEIRDSAEYLKICCDTGDKYRELPSIYHGIVHRGVLEKIRRRSGKYFDGLSPDFSSAYAIAISVDKYAFANYPATIVGASLKSNWGRNSRNMGYEHQREFRDFEFSPLAPDSRSLWSQGADCMVKSLQAMNRKDLLTHYDIERIYARTICQERGLAVKHFSKYFSGIGMLGRNRTLSLLKLLGNVIAFCLVRTIRGIRSKERVSQSAWPKKVMSISEAVEIQNAKFGCQ